MPDCLEMIVGGKREVTSRAAPSVTSHLLDCSRRHHYRGGLSGTQFRRALEFIDSELTLKLTSDRIAAAAGLSKYHFGKAFKQSTGMTLHSYVLARRLFLAQGLLAKSDLPLAAVAQLVGFSSESHFTAIFPARMGTSPGSYRKFERGLAVCPCITGAQRRS